MGAQSTCRLALLSGGMHGRGVNEGGGLLMAETQNPGIIYMTPGLVSFRFMSRNWHHLRCTHHYEVGEEPSTSYTRHKLR